jgi:hypothetical protein
LSVEPAVGCHSWFDRLALSRWRRLAEHILRSD